MKQKNVFKLNFCRICKNKKLRKVLSLGATPPANAFLTKAQLKKHEQFFPLVVNYCSDCGQLQLSHVVSPKLLFSNYVYVSSTSPVFINHFKQYAKSVFDKFSLNNSSLVVDLGSNDGILLRPFKAQGAKILGIDPAKKIAKRATESEIETLPYFFNKQVAQKIVKKYGNANVVTANNVFAHIHDIDEVISGVKVLLNKDGVFIIEAPYLIDLIQKNLFDLVYHEHLSYFSVKTLVILFKRHNMEVFDVKKVASQGGSIRVYVKELDGKYRINKSVEKFLKYENKFGLHNKQTYLKFAKKIERNKVRLTKMLNDLKSRHKKIVGYGAPAKGNTLLNYFKINSTILDYIIDDSEYKQSLYTPGTHIPVVSSDQLSKDNPDYILILAWNFASSLMKKLADYKKSGGHFIIPVPRPMII